jgi:hypothetical protein
VVLNVVFCSEPFAVTRPDPDYAEEVRAAEAAGLQVALMSYETLVNEGQPQAAVRLVAAVEPQLGIYRGWMLPPAIYTDLYGVLRGRGIRLINDPDAYRHCHYPPEWYEELRDVTPRSVWLDQDNGLSMERVRSVAAKFGSVPLVVRDYVKSRKHEWDEACYIPSAADLSWVEQVVQRFLALQGADLAGGRVLREFVELVPIGHHPKSGMPLTREFRLFVLDGSILAVAPY